MWAPEIHQLTSGYHVYFSAKDKQSGAYAIGVAISQNASNPIGPYLDSGSPILKSPGGVIDVHWFRDPMSVCNFKQAIMLTCLFFRTSLPYLLWKTNDWAIWPSKIKLIRINEDGVTFPDPDPVGSAITLITAHFLHEWHCVEAPWLHYRSSFYF